MVRQVRMQKLLYYYDGLSKRDSKLTKLPCYYDGQPSAKVLGTKLELKYRKVNSNW